MNGSCIIHVDMDAFFAAVEVRDNPDLAEKPLIIGALPTERGVVSTCSYEARKYGIHSAMNIKEAYNRCPHGIFMHGNMKKYAEASAKIHKVMLKYTDIIEFVALDEGYMDVTSSIKLFGSAESIGRKLKKEIYEAVGVTCSVGISYSMMGAKLASEEMKPDGFFVIPDRKSLLELIENRPVGIIGGIGKKTCEKLERFGVVTVRNLLDTPCEALNMLGLSGETLLRMASGRDDRCVTPSAETKSIGREHTFQQDISDTVYLTDMLRLLAEDVSFRLKKHGGCAGTVTLKMKSCDMKTITRSKSGEPTSSAREILARAEALFKGVRRTKPVRLIGISVSNLCDAGWKAPAQLSLFDDDNENDRRRKREALSDTVFELKEKFGRGTLQTAKELEITKKYK